MAIPSNTNSWPFHHRDEAEKLMRQKCPNGYEILREEEVVTGQVSHTDTNTETKEKPTLLLGGTERDGDTKGGKKGRSSDSFGALAVPLGETKQTTHQRTSYHDVTEWRIEYRAK